MARPVTVLLADDDKLTLNVLNDTLTRAGYDVVTASDGEQAWKKLHESNAQVAILDWIMPGMEGVEICRRAAQDHEHRRPEPPQDPAAAHGASKR